MKKRSENNRPTARVAKPTAHFSSDSVMICGHRAVAAAVAGRRVRRLWLGRRAGARAQQTAQQARANHVEVIADTDLTTLIGGDSHQGIAAVAALPSAVWADLLIFPAAPLVVLDGVTDPRNLGAVMRTARAFAAAGVITPTRRCAPLSAAAAKASAGAAAFLPIYRVRNLRRALLDIRAAGWFVVGASDKADLSVDDADLTAPLCWVFGDEGGGMRRLTAETCDMLVRAPTAAGESGCLNVSAACAVMLALSAKSSAPRVGLEPTTQRLTAACSTN